MTPETLFAELIKSGASDLHVKARTPVYVRRLGQIESTDLPVPAPQEVEDLARLLLNDEQYQRLLREMQVSTVFRPAETGPRYRVGICFQRGTLSVAMRHIPAEIPTVQAIGMPEEGAALLNAKRGLILVTGPASSGKTTTVAALLEAYNQTHEAHIVTLEDPVEFSLTSKQCLINQRQVGSDTASFALGLKHVLRQDPDLIYIGELRDLETTSIAMAAAETGHLVISTLQTPNAVTTLEQVIGIFPASQQAQARLQISLTLAGVISQQLVTTADHRRRVAAYEVLALNDAIRNLIRQNQTFRITEAIDTNRGCRSMRRALRELAAQQIISPDDAQRLAEV